MSIYLAKFMLLLAFFSLAACSSNKAKDQPELDSAMEVLKAIDKVASGEDTATTHEKSRIPEVDSIPEKTKPSDKAESTKNDTGDIALPTFKDMLTQKPIPESPSADAEKDENKKEAVLTSYETEITRLPPLKLTKVSGNHNTNTEFADYIPNNIPVSNKPIWREITSGFQLTSHSHRPEVQKEIRRLAKRPKALKAVSQKAYRYLPYILQQINNNGFPTEIALLPFVESGFSLTARSNANAAGLWQFIPETGRRYGLVQTASYDQRLNLHHSTQAAISYLSDLHQRFNGDWFLALAAYNVGEGRIEREIRKNQRLGRNTDFWSLDLPRETRQYVPRLLAYRGIVDRMVYQGI